MKALGAETLRSSLMRRKNVVVSSGQLRQPPKVLETRVRNSRASMVKFMC
jgi:hypothetical protein